MKLPASVYVCIRRLYLFLIYTDRDVPSCKIYANFIMKSDLYVFDGKSLIKIAGILIKICCLKV